MSIFPGKRLVIPTAPMDMVTTVFSVLRDYSQLYIIFLHNSRQPPSPGMGKVNSSGISPKLSLVVSNIAHTVSCSFPLDSDAVSL